MKLVILESPYAGAITENIKYARECLKHSIHQDEAPIASHLLYTQEGILQDSRLAERNLGFAAGLSWLRVADLQVFYTDRGWSAGMIKALEAGRRWEVAQEFRSLRGPTFVQKPPI